MAYSAPGYNCSATSPFGTGADGNVTISSNTAITTNKNYGDLTVDSGVVITITSGVTVKVCGTLHVISTADVETAATAGSTGSSGSSGSTGVTAGVSESCTPTSTLHAGDGTGASTTGAGGSGAAVCYSIGGTYPSVTSGSGGGPGTNGVGGGSGGVGGSMTWYAWILNNGGTMTTPGAPGGNGGDGGAGAAGGSASGSSSDYAAGGGGGGKGGNAGPGGNGGRGGSLTVYYGSTSGSGVGTMTAPGGSGGSAGSVGPGGAGGSGTSSGTSCSGVVGGSGSSGGGAGGNANNDCSSGSGANGASGASASSGSSGTSGTVVTQQIVMVVQPYTIATPTGSSALTGTISGCSTNSTGFTTSATKHYLSVIDDCVLTFTMPAPSSGTRGVFSSNSTSTTTTTCATGTCSVFQPSDYAQLQQTYGMKPSTGTFDAGYTESVTGTLSGTASSLLCSITINSGDTYDHYKCWADYDKQVSLVSQFSAGGATHGTWTATSNSASQTPVWTFTDTSANHKDNVTYTFYAQATPTKNFFGLRQIAIGSTSSSVCTVTLSNAFQGDTAVLTLGASFVSGTVSVVVADTFNSVWKSTAIDTRGGGYPLSEVWTTAITQSATDTIAITMTPLAGSNTASCSVYELIGMQSFTTYSGTGHNTGTSLATGSTSYSGSPFIAIAALASSSTPVWTAGTAFALGGSTSSYGSSEYSTSTTSPTTFPAIQNINTAWSEAGIVLSFGITGANLYLQDSTTGLPFSIGGYAGSTAEVDYASGNPTYYKLNMSETVVDLAGATKIKVSVGGSAFYDAVVPAAEPNPANITMYLSPPSLLDSYVLDVQDLSGNFGPGSLVRVERSSLVFFSGYTDATDSLGINLPAGSYFTVITSGTNEHDANVSLPADVVPGTEVQVQILELTTNGNCAGCTTGTNAAFDSNEQNILVAFNDSAKSTSSVTDTVDVVNGSGTFPVFTRTHTGTFGYVEDIVPCDNDNCNGTIAGEIHVTLAYTDTWGTYSQSVPVQGTGPFASFPTVLLNGNLLGFDLVFGSGPNAPTPLGIAVFFFLLMASSVFGYVSSKFGVVVVAILAAMFSAAGWIVLGGAGAGTFLIAVAVTSFVGYLQGN